LLKQLLFASTAVTLVPSCLLNNQKSAVPLKHITVNETQEAMFASLLFAIIPDTDTPGSKALHLDLFAWKMLDDCTSKAEQEKFLKGLNEFAQFSQKITNNFFNKANLEQVDQVMQLLESKKDISESLVMFYKMSKRLAIQAYTGSEFYMTKVHIYEQIPGRFHGCIKA
jgi:hypothetical protein